MPIVNNLSLSKQDLGSIGTRNMAEVLCGLTSAVIQNGSVGQLDAKHKNSFSAITIVLPDGTVQVGFPTRCPPDAMANNKNMAAQMERKTKLAARLRAKLNK
jgi:hypothetical protein